jgi:hypothetical protein
MELIQYVMSAKKLSKFSPLRRVGRFRTLSRPLRCTRRFCHTKDWGPRNGSPFRLCTCVRSCVRLRNVWFSRKRSCCVRSFSVVRSQFSVERSASALSVQRSAFIFPLNSVYVSFVCFFRKKKFKKKKKKKKKKKF